MPDAETLKFYAENAAEYVQHGVGQRFPELEAFLSRLPVGGDVLELGTGGGRDAAVMLAAGFAVTPSDASPELAAQAEALLGRPVRIMAFDELDEVAAYDGVWASACLLHAPRDELTADLTRIFTALRPGGWLVASFKAGGGEGRDQLGRYYNYPDNAELRAHFDAAARLGKSYPQRT
jgi:SAM-dependent methyltransferase